MVLLAAYSAQAFPKHLFWCGLLSANPMSQVYFEIEDSQVHGNGVGTLMISKQAQDQHNPGWQVIETDAVKAEITWGVARGEHIITGINVDLGRSGHLSASMITDGSGKGFIQANLMNLNYPQGISFDYCSYFHDLGPKPGMTGSN